MVAASGAAGHPNDLHALSRVNGAARILARILGRVEACASQSNSGRRAGGRALAVAAGAPGWRSPSP